MRICHCLKFYSDQEAEPCRCRKTEAMTVDGKSLLFIDEIQESASAILSLRAFKESRPGLEVIAAGSP